MFQQPGIRLVWRQLPLLALLANDGKLIPDRADAYKHDDTGRFRRLPINSSSYGLTALQTTVGDLGKWAANFSNPVVGDGVIGGHRSPLFWTLILPGMRFT